jgi:outer membrane protein insertion porin family
MRPCCPCLAAAALLWALLCLAAPSAARAASAEAAGAVVAVEIVSPQPLPETLVHQAIGEMVGRPFSRLAIRQSLERLWTLGLFADIRVEEVAEGGGVRLRYSFVRRPFIRSIAWEGNPRLSLVDVVEAAGLALGGEVGAAQLEKARRDILAAYRREGYFAARVSIAPRRDPATNGSDVTVSLDAGEQARIGSIRFQGVAPDETERLAKGLDLAVGDRFREPALRQGAQALEVKLRQDGFFEARVSVQPPDWDGASNTVSITLEVSQGPRYRVQFRGVEALKESRLQARLPFADAGVADEAEIATGARQIEAAYREEGYAFAKVSGALETHPDVRVIVFRVTEGPQVTVEAVDFTGNEAFPADRLRDALETKPPGFLRRGLYRQDVLDRDLLVLVGFYRTQGYPDAAAGPAQVTFTDDRRRARISIPIVEGPRVTVGTIAVEGGTAVPADRILAVIPLKSGAAWSTARVADTRQLVERVFARQGYLGAQVEVETARHGDRADITIRVVEGIQTRIGRILIQGLTMTQEEVVRREFTFRFKDPLDPEAAAGRELTVRPGDPLNPEALVELEKRLSLGIFDRVQVGPLRPPSVPYADVEITLQEGKPWRLDLGGGYGTSYGWRVFAELAHENLFGTGQSASLRQEVGQQGERTDLTLRSPWVFGTRWEGDVTLFQQMQQQIGYDSLSAGGAAGVQRELFPEWITSLRGGLRYQAEWVRLSNVDPSLAAADIVPGEQIIAKITPALTLDRRDSILNPTQGSLHSLAVDVATVPIGSDVNFVKAQLGTAWYLDLLPPTVVVLAGRLGLATPFGGDTSLPATERFYAGGATTIRGYPRDRVGPTDSQGNPTGGNAEIILNAEWRVPVWKWLSVAGFVDTGTVTSLVSDLGSAKLSTGVGGGIRLRTPVGPIRFDVGYALNPIPGKDRWQFYLTIGNPF